MRYVLLFLFTWLFSLVSAQSAVDGTFNFEDKPKQKFETIELPSTENQPFIVLNVKLEGNNNLSSTEVYFRFKSDEGWSQWSPILEETHAATKDNTRFLQQETLHKSTTDIQLMMKNSDGNGVLTYRVYFPGNTTPTTSSTQTVGVKKKGGGTCSCPIPSVENRSDWCPSGTCPPDATPDSTEVTHLIVHHSAGANTSSDWAAVVRSIWDYHVNFNGWDDVGYNFLIDPNGVIYEGRGEDIVGAHFSCMNPNTMGICLLGNFENVQPTTAMLNALTELMGYKLCKMNVSPLGTSYNTLAELSLYHISGHRDGNASTSAVSCASGTVCPGENLYQLLPNLRSATDSYTQDCTLDTYSDLIVLSMDANPSSPTAGEVMQLEATMKNAGNAAILSPFEVAFRVNNTIYHTATVNSLSIGESVNLSFDYTFGVSGSYNYCVYGDPIANELNTANNSFCRTVLVNDPVSSVNDVHATESVVVYPNPASSFVQIDSDFEWHDIMVTNALGQVVLQQPYAPKILISSLPNGHYHLTLLGEDKTQHHHFVIFK